MGVLNYAGLASFYKSIATGGVLAFGYISAMLKQVTSCHSDSVHLSLLALKQVALSCALFMMSS